MDISSVSDETAAKLPKTASEHSWILRARSSLSALIVSAVVIDGIRTTTHIHPVVELGSVDVARHEPVYHCLTDQSRRPALRLVHRLAHRVSSTRVCAAGPGEAGVRAVSKSFLSGGEEKYFFVPFQAGTDQYGVLLQHWT